jgi:polysaccharide biosynthesis/export protein
MFRVALLIMLCLAPLSAQPDTTANSSSNRYILGPGDELRVYIADLAEEFSNKTFRIEQSGDVSFPVIGRLHASGLTTIELEQAAKSSLTHVLKYPDVSISMATFGSQSVSVLGAVNAPGLRQLEGHKNLFEVLSLSGGLSLDAGYQVTITRDSKWGRIPLHQTTVNSETRTSTAIVKLKSLLNAANPAENIQILPGDTISVPKADLVYAVGLVVKPGGFPLAEHESLSALQVVSLAQGSQRTAALDKAKILRAIPGSKGRVEIAVNLKQIMSGKGDDVQLQPEDILFVPSSKGKTIGYTTLTSIVSATTGFAVLAGASGR